MWVGVAMLIDGVIVFSVFAPLSVVRHVHAFFAPFSFSFPLTLQQIEKDAKNLQMRITLLGKQSKDEVRCVNTIKEQRAERKKQRQREKAFPVPPPLSSCVDPSALWPCACS